MLGLPESLFEKPTDSSARSRDVGQARRGSPLGREKQSFMARLRLSFLRMRDTSLLACIPAWFPDLRGYEQNCPSRRHSIKPASLAHADDGDRCRRQLVLLNDFPQYMLGLGGDPS